MFDDMSAPPPSYLTVGDAARRLAVVPNTVRALIARGEVPATKVGTQWLIPVDAIERRLSLKPHRGRRLTPAGAWGLLFLAAGLAAPWLEPAERWRMKRHLARHRLVDLRTRLVDRGRARSWRAHPSLLEQLRHDPALMLTGMTAASELRLGLIGSDRVDAYVEDSRIEGVIRRYHLRGSHDANVTLRVVPSFADGWPPTRVAPVTAIALDLLDDPEPRAQQLGHELLGRLVP